ncbi:MAG: EFR1 family ferrodoxin [Lachnospiraceae bacterium]|nr:EFR1 family ferrodoxin [Lachnospiraceae bacterium]
MSANILCIFYKFLREFTNSWEPLTSSLFDACLQLGVDRDSVEGGFYTMDACTKCGVCEKLCKNGNIHLTENGVVWGHDCQQCMACIMWCPNRAIRHPNVPERRRRYHNPNITLKEMLRSEFHVGGKGREI